MVYWSNLFPGALSFGQFGIHCVCDVLCFPHRWTIYYLKNHSTNPSGLVSSSFAPGAAVILLECGLNKWQSSLFIFYLASNASNNASSFNTPARDYRRYRAEPRAYPPNRSWGFDNGGMDRNHGCDPDFSTGNIDAQKTKIWHWGHSWGHMDGKLNCVWGQQEGKDSNEVSTLQHNFQVMPNLGFRLEGTWYTGLSWIRSEAT